MAGPLRCCAAVVWEHETVDRRRGLLGLLRPVHRLFLHLVSSMRDGEDRQSVWTSYCRFSDTVTRLETAGAGEDESVMRVADGQTCPFLVSAKMLSSLLDVSLLVVSLMDKLVEESGLHDRFRDCFIWRQNICSVARDASEAAAELIASLKRDVFFWAGSHDRLVTRLVSTIENVSCSSVDLGKDLNDATCLLDLYSRLLVRYIT